jgi:murein DD-endopeptidase MepM/ murein hydrolase activator NlpD
MPSTNSTSKIRDFFLKKIKINGLNPTTYKPYWGIEVSRLTLFSSVFVVFLLFFGISYVMLSYTPLKGVLPDTVRNTDRKLLEDQTIKIDSLIAKITLQDKYVEDVRRIILGEYLEDDFVSDSLRETSVNSEEIDQELSESERALAEKVRDDLDAERGFQEESKVSDGIYFFPPVSGTVSQKMSENHKGVDVVTVPNEPVKAVLEGLVIFSDWTNKDGRTIIVSHGEKFVSIYKHNSVLLKKVGDKVKAGDPIAIVGNTGENSTGPHLHFELIFEGKYVNPLNYISFR